MMSGIFFIFNASPMKLFYTLAFFSLVLGTSFHAMLPQMTSKAPASNTDPVSVPPSPSIKTDHPDVKSKSPAIAPIPLNREAVRLFAEGAILDIPRRAMPDKTPVSITKLDKNELPPLDPDLINVTPDNSGYRCLPDGARFARPVILSMPFDSCLIPDGYTSDHIQAFFYDESTKRWIALPTDTLLASHCLLASKTTHFTDFINGIIKTPDAPETQAYTPTQIKDLKAADPSANIPLIQAPEANNMGSASTQFPIRLPAGRQGVQPALAIRYNNEGGNGWLGLSWDLSISSISIETRWGVPLYDATQETETYTMDGGMLTPVFHRTAPPPRQGDRKQFWPRVEGDFRKTERHGSGPKEYWWEVTAKDGTKYFYGGSPENGLDDETVLKDDAENITQWCLREIRDLNGNFVRYHYATVSHTGVPGGSVEGRQIYIRKISYTGYGAEEGLYTVEFFRDGPDREDVQIDARLGFKRVTADLLRRIEVNFDGNPVRSYALEYEAGAFSKTLLTAIVEYDQEGEEFYRHAFEYWDDVRDAAGNYQPYGPETAWTVPNDLLQGIIQNADQDFNGKTALIGGSTSEQSSSGGAVNFGLPILCGTKEASAGFNFSSSDASSEGKVALIDINGDNLPDKVFRKNDRLYYCPNLSATQSFGPAQVIEGIAQDQFSRSSSIGNSWGWEVNLFAFFGGNNSDNLSRTDVYFADFNGDGLTDIAANNLAYFNSIDANGHPVFSTQSSSTVNPIITGAALDATLLVIDPAEQLALAERNPLHDVVRVWRAPYDGIISIYDTIRRIQRLDVDAQNYRQKDSLHISVQVGNQVRFSTYIGPNDYTDHIAFNVSNIAIQRDTKVYFRIKSVFDGAYDEVYWNPTIVYSNIPDEVDANGRNIARFRASEDFLLASPQMVTFPYKGQVRIQGQLTKPVTSDSLLLQIIRRRNQTDVVLHEQSFASSDSATFGITLDTLVEALDELSFKLKSSTNIDWPAISYMPLVSYLNAVDGANEPVRVLNAQGNPFITYCPAVDYSILSEVIKLTEIYYPGDTGTLVVWPRFMTSQSNPPYDPPLTGEITLSIKGVKKLYDHTTFRFSNNTIDLQADLPLVAEVLEGEPIYIEYHIAVPRKTMLDSLQILGVDADLNSVDQTIGHGIFTHVEERNMLLGSLYRGWGQFIYNGNPPWGEDPIDENQIMWDPAYENLPPVSQSTVPADFEHLFNPIKARFIVMVADVKGQRWQGYDDRTWIKRDTMSSSRMGDDDIRLDLSIPLADSALTVPDKISKSESESFSGGLSVQIPGVPFGTSLSGSSSKTTTLTLLDLTDYNGDRYPDVVSESKIQYTNTLGGRVPSAIPHNQLYGHRSDAEALAIGLGGSFVRAQSNNTEMAGGGSNIRVDARQANVQRNTSNCKEAPKSASFSLSLNANINFGGNEDKTKHTWLDVNGDGLPDKLEENGDVALNVGYRFAPAERWAFSSIRNGKSSDISGGGGLGVNLFYLSFASGFGLSKTDNEVVETLQDVNGDGLLDIVTLGNPVKVAFNTGQGFTSPKADWTGTSVIEKGSSTGESSNVAATLCVHLLPFFPVVKFCVSLNHSSGTGVSRSHDQLSDIDGDGFPDLLYSNDDGHLVVRNSNIRRTNLLKTVHNPLGGSFTLDYAPNPNTYTMPNSKWVLSSVEINDGLPNDGASSMKTTFQYEEGAYNRRERDFYGFKTVRSEQRNTLNNDTIYRVVVQTYDNSNYYVKGLLLSEVLEDVVGNKYTETVNTYELRDLFGLPFSNPSVNDFGVAFPALLKTEKRFYEGQPVAGLQTEMTYGYDPVGNVTYHADSGDGSPEDLIQAEIDYHTLASIYLLSSPSSIRVLTAQGELRHRETTIDSTGNVTQIRQFLDPNTTANYDMEYDAYGNLTKISRPANYLGQRLWFAMTFDSTVFTYVTRVDDAYGYSSTSIYDLSFGQLLESTDLNKEKIRYSIDAAGRIDTITGPYEIAANKPYTIFFEYHPDAPVSYAKTGHFDPEHEADIETYTFMDGLARPVQVKKTGALFGGPGAADQKRMIVSGRVKFDAFGRTTEQFYPLSEGLGTEAVFNNTFNSTPPTVTTYDVLDRPLATTLPDGAETNMGYAIHPDNLGQAAFSTTITDALGNIRQSFTDLRERKHATREVGPAGDIWTTFRYNALSELLTVIDTHNDSTLYTYDRLGRKLSVRHPDAGLTEMVYDLSSNILTRLTAQLKASIADTAFIRYTYDYQRITQIDYPKNYQNQVKFHYGKAGDPHRRAGRVWLQEDASGGQEFFYGPLGEVVKTIRTLLIDPAAMETYVSETEYDTWNRVQKIFYPDGEVVDYEYNEAGKVRRVTGLKKNRHYTYLDHMGYDEFEQRVFSKLGNGVVTTYNYEMLRRRLSGMNVVLKSGRKVMDNRYTYDAVSNVTSLVNAIISPAPGLMGGPASHNFTYDELYRLSTASGLWRSAHRQDRYNLVMEYDNQHNIVIKKQGHLRDLVSVPATNYEYYYSYNGAQPHAPDQIGYRRYTYDANGNNTGWYVPDSTNWQLMLWDEENRLMAVSTNGFVSRYTYDANGERAIKSSGGMQSVFLDGAPTGFINHHTNYTAYVSPYLVTRANAFTKHYFIEGQRIASKTGYGYFQNRYHFGQGLTAGSLNFNIRAGLMRRAINSQYRDLSQPPSVPTAQGIHSEPENTGIPFAPLEIPDSLYRIPPPGWVLSPNDTLGAPGTPIAFLPPTLNNDNVRAGYGFNDLAAFHTETNQYFYHSDHLGSTSYITGLDGELRQHLEYLPFGETLVDEFEHSTDPRMPYRYSGKEQDEETGFYYYGARYYAPRESLWLSVDPMAEKYPGWSPYNYTLQNPLKYVDPDGRFVETAWDLVSLGMGIKSLKDNIENGNFGSAAIDAVGVVADALAVATPILPGGVGAAIKGAKTTADAVKMVDKANDTKKAAALVSKADGIAGQAISKQAAKEGGQSLVQANRTAGNNFRDELADLLQQEGREVSTEVYKKTPFGKRFIDIEVSQGGKVLGGIETKVGSSRYHPLQRLKDLWLEKVEGYPVNLVRKPSDW